MSRIFRRAADGIESVFELVAIGLEVMLQLFVVLAVAAFIFLAIVAGVRALL